MSGTEDELDDLAEGIVGVEEYEALSPPKKGFLPWHKPRKQFVREKQWCDQILKLLDDCAQMELEKETIRYCGLPGIDLIDLRYFHERICVTRSIDLRFLGFNTAAAPDSTEQIELNISLDEITKLPHIDPQSEIVQDDIRTLANTSSMGWSKAAQFGPFDVVNLDLCDGLAKEEAGQFNDNYYNAVAQIMAIQARRKTPWLLLLTTRVGKEHVNAVTSELLNNRYLRNLTDCGCFKKLSQELFSIENETELKSALDDAVRFGNVFLTSVCKWLLALGLEKDVTMEVKSVLGYRVLKSAKAGDLVSLAIRFTPQIVPPNDPLSLATIKTAPFDECAFATKALNRIGKQKDVDTILLNDQELFSRMKKDMEELLFEARYDVSAYLEWVAADS